MQTDELDQWKSVLRAQETELAMLEAGMHKKGMSADYKRTTRARLAAVTCARDAVARKLTKVMLAQPEGDPSA
jgi:hypothetical protein